MYDPAGHFYVYFIYGIHWLRSIVTCPAGVTKALQIDKSLYRKPTTPESDLWFEGRVEKVGKIIATPRIGVDYAGE